MKASRAAIMSAVFMLAGCDLSPSTKCAGLNDAEARDYSKQQLLGHLEKLAAERIMISDKGLSINSKAFQGVEAADLSYVGELTGDGPLKVFRFKIDRIPSFEFTTWLAPSCEVDFSYSSAP